MKELSNVTLVLVDTVNYGQAVNSLQKSLEQIKPARTIFFTDIDISIEGIEVIKIQPLHSKREYSEFIIKQLGAYIKTDYVLVTQWDAWVLNGDSWMEEFLDFDYIGAPWLYIDERNVGNGGFSLRSNRLQRILLEDKFIEVCDPEDEVIGRLYREYLENKYGILFPPVELADHFSFELRTPIHKTFGFHGFFHQPYQPTVIIKRTGAMGDVIACEPVLHYFFKKGYRVVLDTLPQFQNLFIQHYFKVHSMGELDPRVLDEAKRFNLDMSYESRPKQLHLKSYFEFCGIRDYEIRNPKLTMNFNARSNRLFRSYVVIHNDVRPQASRNIERIDWRTVTGRLAKLGFFVMQIGVGEHTEIPGAVYINTPSEMMLMWLVGGADFFIGIDSGPANVAIAMDVPAILFYGSVNPEHIIPDRLKVVAINNHSRNVCSKPYCWSDTIGCTGTPCYIDDLNPPCNKFHTEDVLNAIDEIIQKR